MNYISVACDVLSAIEETMDDEHFDAKAFTAERFGVSECLFSRLLGELRENEYIEGVEEDFDAEHFARVIKLYRPWLTLKGAEFLVRHRPNAWTDA